MSDIAVKVALVTGAGRGVGAYLARALASQGMVVGVNDVNPDSAGRTVAQIEQLGGRAKAYLVDIAKKMSVQVMANELEDDWGRVDLLVNNAVVNPQKSLLDMDEWDWRRAVDVNLTGPYLMIQVFGRQMRSLDGGLIINITSTLDYAFSREASAAFIASQAALEGLTFAAARELAESRIWVNAIRLGQLSGWDDAPLPAAMPGLAGLQPTASTPLALAQLVLALAGDPIPAITGRLFEIRIPSKGENA